jgi:DNA polymerase I-like protein with 3'-5' exonuclease and polymerase domains
MIYVFGEVTQDSLWIDPHGNLRGAIDPVVFEYGRWEDFTRWLDGLREVEFDIETTVTPWWCDKKIRTLQFGNPRNQWVLQYSKLTAEQLAYIRMKLESKQLIKLIHNAMFECVIMLFHGVRIQEVFDTMLAEQVFYGGERDAFGIEYGLDDVCRRRLGVYLDKSYQTAFNEDILTPGHIGYAAQDVRYLTLLKKEIYQQIQCFGLEWTLALENEVVLAFAEMVYNGMEIDEEWWTRLEDEAAPLLGAAEGKLNEWLKSEELAFIARDLGYISDSDRILLNWNSPKQRQKVLFHLFPDIGGATKPIVQKYVSNQLKVAVEIPDYLHEYLLGNFLPMTEHLLSEHRGWLIAEGLLIAAGTPTINWNSVDQVLPVIQWVEPKIKDLSEESRGRCSHPIILDYEDFKDTYKLTSSYGRKFIEKYREPDGKIRTSFNQILTTGRIASARPNMQNIPAKESVGNKYRNAFLPPAGWSFVSSDYVSQELIIIAYLSRDPVWLEALSKGQDLHSICAEMVFKSKWRDAAEEGCAYYKPTTDEKGHRVFSKVKCSCKKHKYMRNGVKTINFGLAYGMSHFKLAATLRISVPEAMQLIQDYFRAFPGIGALLEYLGHFGLDNGYIQTIYPFYRRRYFPYWGDYIRFIDSHKMGAQYHPGLGEIERASKNMPIQGTAADMMKLALVLIYWEIHENSLEELVRMAMQVHDQADNYCRNDYRDIWRKRQTELMEEAAQFIIPTGILKADTTITERWSK